MTNIGDILKSENLLDVSWDGQKLREVFFQTIKIFQSQEKQINLIQEQIDHCATKELFDKLNDEVDDLATTQLKQKKEMEKLIQTKIDGIMDEIEKVKELVNSTNNETLTESKRMIGVEIQEVKDSIEKTNLECKDNAGKNASLETEINILKKKIEKSILDSMQANQTLSDQQKAQPQLLLASQNQSLQTPIITSDPAVNESLASIEGRLRALEDQIKQFPEV